MLDTWRFTDGKVRIVGDADDAELVAGLDEEIGLGPDPGRRDGRRLGGRPPVEVVIEVGTVVELSPDPGAPSVVGDPLATPAVVDGVSSAVALVVVSPDVLGRAGDDASSRDALVVGESLLQPVAASEMTGTRTSARISDRSDRLSARGVRRDGPMVPLRSVARRVDGDHTRTRAVRGRAPCGTLCSASEGGPNR